MDDSLIYEIQSFLPIKLEEFTITEYISYHLNELSKSLENNIDSWIFLHTHILYMIFIYIQLLRISQNKVNEFKYSRIWLPADEKTFLESNNSPFAFSKIKEKTVFRFFRLIDFDDAIICEISSCVKERNELLHATWVKILDLENKVYKYIKNMKKVREKSMDFLMKIFNDFENNNPDFFEDWYEINHDDLELNLYTPYFFSESELWIISSKIDDKMTKAIKLDLQFDDTYFELMNFN